MSKLYNHNLNKCTGFTLIELLLAIAIIGILSSMVVVSLSGNKAKARDAIRAGDLKSLSQAAERYQVEGENLYLFPQDINNFDMYFADGVRPKDPRTGNDYSYSFSNSNPKSYCFGAVMETEEMYNDVDCDSGDATANYKVKGP